MDDAGSVDYCTRIVSDLAQIEPAQWNALLPHGAAGAMFVRHEYLHALHASDCASARTGWEPQFLTVWSSAQLLAAAPLYRKHHSYGEYVFDWAWAAAHERHGIAYYPKWLVAVPFTPVPGPRLLARDAVARARLIAELVRRVESSDLVSAHLLFAPADEVEQLADTGLQLRRGVQFHWFNHDFHGFDDYLASLTQPKRKKVRAERRRVAQAGVHFERRTGAQISAADWRFFVRCYERTYAEHHSVPYLNEDFFQRLAAALPEQILLVLARLGQEPVAAALALFDEQRLYGRYWGATQRIDCLHFETSYYQMIEFAIERGLRVFEGGAQGEHKLARGFEPVPTHSAHWLAHPAFADAVARALERESGGIDAYVDELTERSALRRREGER